MLHTLRGHRNNVPDGQYLLVSEVGDALSFSFSVPLMPCNPLYKLMARRKTGVRLQSQRGAGASFFQSTRDPFRVPAYLNLNLLDCV